MNEAGRANALPPKQRALQPILDALAAAGKPQNARAVMATLGGRNDTVGVVAGLRQLVELELVVEVPSDGPNTLFDLPPPAAPAPAPTTATGRAGKSQRGESARIRAFMANAPYEFDMATLQRASDAAPDKVANLVHAMVSAGRVCRKGKGATARFWLRDRTEVEFLSAKSPAAPARNEDLPMLDSLVHARREADRRLRSLALTCGDDALREVAQLAIDLNDRVDALARTLRL